MCPTLQDPHGKESNLGSRYNYTLTYYTNLGNDTFTCDAHNEYGTASSTGLVLIYGTCFCSV